MTDTELSEAVAREVMGWCKVNINGGCWGDSHAKLVHTLDWSCLTPDAMCSILDKIVEDGGSYVLEQDNECSTMAVWLDGSKMSAEGNPDRCRAVAEAALEAYRRKNTA